MLTTDTRFGYFWFGGSREGKGRGSACRYLGMTVSGRLFFSCHFHIQEALVNIFMKKITIVICRIRTNAFGLLSKFDIDMCLSIIESIRVPLKPLKHHSTFDLSGLSGTLIMMRGRLPKPSRFTPVHFIFLQLVIMKRIMITFKPINV